MQYFRPEPLPSRKNNAAETCHFSAYSWEEHIVGSMRRRTYVVDIVSIESILDHALMIPDFTTDPVCGEPKNTDQFWMIPREFCDRSGWDNITSIIPPPLLPIVLPTSKEDSEDEDGSSCNPSLFAGSEHTSSSDGNSSSEYGSDNSRGDA